MYCFNLRICEIARQCIFVHFPRVRGSPSFLHVSRVLCDFSFSLCRARLRVYVYVCLCVVNDFCMIRNVSLRQYDRVTDAHFVRLCPFFPFYSFFFFVPLILFSLPAESLSLTASEFRRTAAARPSTSPERQEKRYRGNKTTVHVYVSRLILDTALSGSEI